MAASLWQKLLSAFASVIVLGGVVQAVLVNQATQGRFDEFVSRSGQAYAQEVAPALAAYYDANQGWNAVSAQGADLAPTTAPTPANATPASATPAIATPASATPDATVGEAVVTSPATMGGMGSMRRMHADGTQATVSSLEPAARSEVEGDTAVHGSLKHETPMSSHMMSSQIIGSSIWTHMGVRLVLTDDQGKVVADTVAPAVEATPAVLTAGTVITADGRTVGTLYALNGVDDSASLARDFLAAAQRSAWLASGVAGAVALLMGLGLFRQIVAPVRQVTAAAQAMTAGKLDQRVEVTSRDEIGQLATAFNQMADAVAQQQLLRRNLIADVAHELRTPLSVIQGNLEAMLDGVLPAEPDEIASLYEETLLLTRLVGDLRLLSVAEAGQLTLERKPVALGSLLQRVVEPIGHQADASQVTLTLHVDSDLPLVLVDGDRIGQVLSNLLQNALRHTGGGGRIYVAATTIAGAGGRLEVVVEVADTGSGIAANDLPYVFDRFYRGDKSRSRATGGTGIGLALAKQLVEAHGGRIWAESVPGQGSTFRFTLPVML
jgi:signal transduction histidine kinase